MIERAKLPLLEVLGARGGRDLRRPAPRARCRAAAGRRGGRDHRRRRPGHRRAPGRRQRRSAPTRSWSAWASPPTPSWPRRPACTSTTASSSTSTWPPPTPTYSPPATSPTPTTRCCGTHLRLEHWSAALNQGPVAAANMMGRDASYDHVPYFFSDQYDMGMEYSGYVAARRLRPGRLPRRRRPAASSSPSGCATDGCWPA